MIDRLAKLSSRQRLSRLFWALNAAMVLALLVFALR